MPIPLMHLIQIDVVGAEPPQACLRAPNDVMPGCSGVVRALTHRQPHLGRDQYLVAIRAESLTQDLFREAAGVDVGGVEKIDSGVTRQPYLLPSPFDVDLADGSGPAGAAKSHGAKGDRRNTKAASAKLSILHAGESRTTVCPARARLGTHLWARRPKPEFLHSQSRSWQETADKLQFWIDPEMSFARSCA